jgi:hypothetical protein
MIAWRNGCTPNETLAMIAIAASTAAGLSHPMLTGQAVRAGRAGSGSSTTPGSSSPRRGSRRSRGHPTAESAGIVAGHATFNRHAQCPRHVHCLARPRTSAATLTSHGRGGR